ncbi:unnamed protein product [Cylicostephanus goldi]|uniref:Uncharacterized protein n=1 Tax=Cylicostephanus goldi TaxID=71465 RepID=A0A3P6RY59_CYLGO|nr:unnamed protein product [Cylicostephanus goldi]
MPEIRKYAGDNVPVLLVGTKEDLLETANDEQRVSFDAARRAASQVKELIDIRRIGQELFFDD